LIAAQSLTVYEKSPAPDGSDTGQAHGRQAMVLQPFARPFAARPGREWKVRSFRPRTGSPAAF